MTDSEIRLLLSRITVQPTRQARRDFIRGLPIRDQVRYLAVRSAYSNARMLGIHPNGATAEAFEVAAFIDGITS